MTHSIRTSLYATAAISAALAFGSTPLLAQDAAAPAIQLPPAAVPAPVAPAPQPTIVLPDPPAPAAEAPAAERPAPKAAVERPAPRAERAAPRSAPQAVAQPASAPASAAAPIQTAPTTTDAGPAVLQPPVDTQPVDTQPVAANEPGTNARQQDSVSSSVDMPDELLAAIGLGIVALGGIGVVAAMRRHRHRAELENAVYEPEPQYVAEAPITSIPEELEVRQPQYATFETEAADSQPAHQAFAMPQGPVPTGEARQSLLDAMVAAAPDAANPFTSAKARRKRARIILQSRERAQRQDATQPFDWRTYRSPAADPATPPMVDA